MATNCDRLENETPKTEASIKNYFRQISQFIRDQNLLLVKKIRNRTPDGLKEFFNRHIFPYLSILVVTAFVLIATSVEAAGEGEYIPNEEVMDLNPAEVAKTVSAINPYTANFDEDSVQVVLAMKDQDYLGKPVITETAQTEVPQEAGERKSTITYTVEGNDTLSSIGWKFGLKIATIKAVNNLNSDLIKEGQQLKIPPSDLSKSYLASLAQKKTGGGSSSPKPFAGTFRRPTSGWHMSQGFGHTSFERWHTGVDLDSRSGLTIMASASGRVATVRRGWGGGYGNHVIINHGDGFSTLYGHMSTISVSVGQWVNQGQSIGVMGSTGWSTGTHVHFEIRQNGVAKNPLDYL